MEPNDIPIVSGASGAGGGKGTPPASVDALRQFAAQVEENVDRHTRELAEATRSAAAAAEEASDTALGQTFVDIQNRAVDAAKRVQKGADVLFREARDRAADAEARAHGAITAVGGTPLVMTDEAYAVNQAGSHAGEAIERIIIPAIDQQARLDESVSIDQRIDGPPTIGAPPGTLPPSLGQPLPPDDKPIPIPGLPTDPVPFNPPPDPFEPDPPPAPFVPPPPPADNGQCCPPQQIIVPAPVVNILLPGGGSVPVIVPPPPPPPPPPGVPPPPPPPPPSPPDPLAPTTPPAPPPPPGVVLPPIPATPNVDPLGVFDGPEVCGTLAGSIKSFNNAGGTLGSIPETIIRAIGNSPLASQPIIGPFIQAIASAVGGAISTLAGNVETLLPQVGIPNPKAALAHLSAVSGFNIVDRYLGTDTSYYAQAFEQAGRAANPLTLVSQGDIDRMYLAARIGIDQWECMTRLHGHMPWQHEEAMKASQSRLSLGELIQSARRGLISLDTYMAEARALGFLDDRYPSFAYQLSEYVPSTPDLFTWIKKDVFRDDFAERFGLDEDFPNDLPPAFQRWFEANGTSADQIKYDYRAQWRLPSTTQLGEMVARLRPGRVDPKVQITPEDADQLLKLDEWPARLRGQILATLQTPINRTDLIEAYKAGTVNDTELVERLMDLKYSRTDSEFLARMIRAKSIGQTQGSMGAWTRRRIVKEYISGTITRDEADLLLSRTVLAAGERVGALDDADTIAGANRKRSCIKGIRRRYFTGELDVGQARAELTAQGVGLTVAAELLAGWTCERRSRSKEPTVKQLTEWVTLGIITVDEFRRRLENLGYTADDAQRIIIAADAALRQKQAKGRR